MLFSRYLYITLASSMFLFSCGSSPKNESKVIAQAFNRYLYETDVASVIPEGLSKEDSSAFAEKFVSDWEKESVLAATAEKYVSTDEINLDYRVEQYKNDLLIYEYERLKVAEDLDTNVAFEQIKTYYDAHADEFVLQEDIVRAMYFYAPNTAKNMSKARIWYKLYEKEKDLINIKKFCLDSDMEFFYDDTNWMTYTDLESRIPTKIDKGYLFRIKHRTFYQDAKNTYFVHLLDKKLKGQPAPVNFHQEKIKKIILNQRANELRERNRKEMYENAKKNAEVKRF